RRRCDVGTSQLEPVTGMLRKRAVGEPRVVERAEEPIAAPIAGEHTAGAIASVGRGRQTHDEHACMRIAESRQWLRPVRLTAVSLRWVHGHRFAVANEAWTQPTRDDSLDEPDETTGNFRQGASHAQKRYAPLRARPRNDSERRRSGTAGFTRTTIVAPHSTATSA